MRIFHLGDSIKNIFPVDTMLIGRHLEDVFRLVRPDVVFEWNTVCLELFVGIKQSIMKLFFLGTFLWSTCCLCY